MEYTCRKCGVMVTKGGFEPLRLCDFCSSTRGETMELDKIYTAHWNGEEYVVEEWDWRSEDGDEWFTGDGVPCDGDVFQAARIELVGGPRHGQMVS